MTIRWHLNEITNSSGLHLEVMKIYLTFLTSFFPYENAFFFFAGLPDKRLYPSVSAVYGNTEVSMVYLGPPLDG